MVELLSARVKKNRPYRRLEGFFPGQFPPTKPECSLAATYLDRQQDLIGKKSLEPDGQPDCQVRITGLPSGKVIQKATLTGPRNGIWLDRPNPDRWLFTLEPEGDTRLLTFSFWAHGQHRLELQYDDQSTQGVTFHVYFPGSPYFEARLGAAKSNVRVIRKVESAYTEVMASVLKNLLSSGELVPQQ